MQTTGPVGLPTRGLWAPRPTSLPTITATADITQADTILVATATVAVAASANLTQADTTLVATAQVAVAATAALTQADTSLSATATAAVSATANLTQEDTALSASAAVAIAASADLVQDDTSTAILVIPVTPPPETIGGKPERWRPQWRYQPKRKKKRELERALERIEEAIEAPSSPFVIAGETAEADLIYTNAVTLRLERLIADIDAAIDRARTAKAQADLDNLLITALVLRDKLEEEEQMIAMLLLHL